MSRLRALVAVATLAVAALLSVASLYGGDDDDGHWTPPPDPVPEYDETYLVENLWDGQTSVPRGHVFDLTVGTRDLLNPGAALEQVRLRDLDAERSVELEATIGYDRTVLAPLDPLEADHDYVLQLQGLAPYLQVRRWVPGDLHFSTRTAPRLVSLWRSEDTLLVLFSEPMDPATLRLGPGSVDLLWTDADGAVISLAETVNLANLAWDTIDELFRLAPLDRDGPLWLTVAAAVESERGAPLDDAGDGSGGGVEDDVVVRFFPEDLPTCATRSDIPDPCVDPTTVPDLRW
jgi:hypothetical protein